MPDDIQKLIQDEKELTRQGVVLDYVKNDVSKLNAKVEDLIKKIDDKYVTHEEYDLFKDAVVQNVKELATKEEIAPLLKDVAAINANISRVVWFVILAVLGGVMSLIIIK